MISSIIEQLKLALSAGHASTVILSTLFHLMQLYIELWPEATGITTWDFALQKMLLVKSTCMIACMVRTHGIHWYLAN